MSDDLVKRARHNAQADMPHYASVGLIEEMADCIEELEAQLAKAVMALQKIATVTKDGTGHNLAPVVRLAQRIEGISRATLVELKGEQQ